jgi:hypothetical protein
MSAAKGGRSLQECLTSLGASVKRRKHGEQLSSSKRQRVLDDFLPIVLSQHDEDNAMTGSKNNHDPNKDSAKPDEVIIDFVEYAKEQKLLITQEMERMEEKRRAFFSKQSDLIAVYMYGLDKISQLADVRDAPDAILPGNQV